MPLTLLDLLRERALRRATGQLPPPDPSPSPYAFVPPIDAADIEDGQILVYDEASRRLVPGDLLEGPAGPAGATGGVGATGAQGPAGNTELGAAQIVSSYTTPATIGTHAVTGLTKLVTVAARPIIVELTGWALTAAAAQNASLWIFEDGVGVAAATVSLKTVDFHAVPALRVRRTPAPGAHTYDVRIQTAAANTVTLGALATAPSLLTVNEV